MLDKLEGHMEMPLLRRRLALQLWERLDGHMLEDFEPMRRQTRLACLNFEEFKRQSYTEMRRRLAFLKLLQFKIDGEGLRGHT